MQLATSLHNGEDVFVLFHVAVGVPHRVPAVAVAPLLPLPRRPSAAFRDAVTPAVHVERADRSHTA